MPQAPSGVLAITHFRSNTVHDYEVERLRLAAPRVALAEHASRAAG
ncbi:MAG TPA: hypothetical protein VF647_16050 [Longimicrobium sp.]